MCHICKNLLKDKLTFKEARTKLPKLIDLETVKSKKLHYEQLYGNLEKAFTRVFGKNSHINRESNNESIKSNSKS